MATWKPVAISNESHKSQDHWFSYLLLLNNVLLHCECYQKSQKIVWGMYLKP